MLYVYTNFTVTEMRNMYIFANMMSLYKIKIYALLFCVVYHSLQAEKLHSLTHSGCLAKMTEIGLIYLSLYF